MNKFKLIISLLLIIAIFFSSNAFCFTASADEARTSFWDWGQYFFPPGMLKVAYDRMPDKVNSDCNHSWVRTGSVFGSSGNSVTYYQCSVCGENMTVDGLIAGAAYNQYVNELPATGYDSEGGLIIELPHDYAIFFYSGTVASVSSYCDHGILPNSSSYSSHKYITSRTDLSGSFNCSPFSSSLVVYPSSGKENFSFSSFDFYFSAQAPISGFYKVVDPIRYTGAFVDKAVSYGINFCSEISSGLGTFYNSGDVVSRSFKVTYHDITGIGSSNSRSTSVNSLRVTATAPKILITPADSAAPQINLTYAPDTRVTNIIGDVAYYDVNGNLQLVPNISIVNEGNKTYYNPVTNTTNTVSNWSYDYSDRSYTLELNTGDTTTVTYGDEYIRIQEGDTVYNVYYVTNNTTPPLTHTHEWYQTGATQATCTEYGQKVYTCYTCNEQKTEVLPALGHDWVQSGSFDAIVDEEGNETEPAYVLYVCSRYGEEYKDYDGVGPPAPPEPPPSEDDSSGILAWLKQFKIWLGEKLDKLTGGDTIIDNDYNITYVDEDGEEQEVKVKDIADKFAWWKQVADIGQTFVSQVAASEAAAYAYSADGARAGPTGAPSIPLDLSRAQSYYGVDYGGEIEMLDLSWYTPYKKTVDDLVSGFMWLFFLWSLFKRFPAIIAGEGLVESRLSELRSSGSGSYSSSGVPLLPSKRKGR